MLSTVHWTAPARVATMNDRLKRHMSAGEETDLPGHCRFCGEEITGEPHLMQDPSGQGKPIEFCSAECLYDAEHTFDGLSPEKLQELEIAVSQQEAKSGIRQ